MNRWRHGLQRVEGVDAAFLYLETRTVHMHTLKIAVLEADPHLTFDDIVAGLLGRLRRMPPLRKRVLPVPGSLNHPLWVTQRRIDPVRHVHRHRVGGSGSTRDLERLVGQIASTPLDRSRPLWELHWCEGLEGGRTAIVGKIHHALADGSAANQILANIVDVRSAELPPPVVDVDDGRPLPEPWLLALIELGGGVRQALTLPALLLRTAHGLAEVVRHRRVATARAPLPVLHAPRTSWNRPLTASRSIATATLPLAEMKRIRAQHAAHGTVTLNDVVLAVVSGALRRWLAEHDEHPRRSLTAGVPVGVDEAGAAPRLAGNRVSNLFTTLATDVDDPAERLRVIARTTHAAKEVSQRLGPQVLVDWTQFAPPALLPPLVRLYSRLRAARWHPPPFNVIVSNVPGPRQRAAVGTARVAALHSVGPLVEGIGLNVTVWSYVDAMAFTLLACPDLLPDVERVAELLPEALAELDLETEPHAPEAPSGPTAPIDGRATA